MKIKTLLLLSIPVGIIAIAAYGFWQGTPQDVVNAVRARNLDRVRAAVRRDPQAVHTKVYAQAYETMKSRQDYESRTGKSAWGGRYIIHDAVSAWIDPVPMVALLAELGADMNVRLNGLTLLQVAVRDGDPETVKWLLEHGADANATNNCDNGCAERGETALFDTLKGRHFSETTTLLFAHGANPNARSDNGRTPLHANAAQGAVGSAWDFCRHGADPRLEDRDGRTPQELALAVDAEQAEWLKPGGYCEMLADRAKALGKPLHEDEARPAFKEFACARDKQYC